MGNSHGHRKHRNGRNEAASPPFKYGPSDHAAAQMPSSSKPKTQNNMVCLPYGHVDSTLRALAGQAEGFGRLAVGGLHGPLYHVTTLGGQLNSSIMYMKFKFWLWGCVFKFQKLNS